MLAAFSMIAIVMQAWATKKHNRFLLLMAFCFDTVCLGIVIIIVSVTRIIVISIINYYIIAALISLGVTLLDFTKSPFEADLKADCLLHKPQRHSIEECMLYLSHPRTTGFRVVWESLYNDRKDTISFQIMTNIQTDTCCGFFNPMNCTDSIAPFKDPFPTTYYLQHLSPAMASQHTQCGPYPGFYKEEETCTDFYDAAAVIPIVGGCRTDMGVATCVKLLSLEVEADSKGCADEVEVYVGNLLLPTANFIMGTTLFNFISMLYACCLLWKRKETDVFPEFTVDMSAVKDIDYKEVPLQFAVLPSRSILSRRGFLPKTAEEIYAERLIELARRRAAGFSLDDMESGETKKADKDDHLQQNLIELNSNLPPTDSSGVENQNSNAVVDQNSSGVENQGSTEVVDQNSRIDAN